MLTNQEEVRLLEDLGARQINHWAWASTAHVWTTVISSVDVTKYLAPNRSRRQFLGSFLAQFGLVVGSLRDWNGVHFGAICVLTAASNKDGFSVIIVFVENFPHITREARCNNVENRTLGEVMIRRASVAFQPRLIWETRRAKLKYVDTIEGIAANLQPNRGRITPYWLLLRPLDEGGGVWALLLLSLARVAAAVGRCNFTIRIRLIRQAPTL